MKMGLFELIQSGKDLQSLAGEGGWDENRLALFLQYLNDLQLVQKVEDQWYLTAPFAQEWKNRKRWIPLIAWETCLQSSWLRESEIVSALTEGPRVFDQIGLEEKALDLYAEAMYGESGRFIGLQLKRLLAGKENVNILEAGRSPGVVMENLIRLTADSRGTVMIFPEMVPLALTRMESLSAMGQVRVQSMDGSELDERFDLICVMNTIHYWTLEEAHHNLSRFRRLLKEDGKFVVIDFFLDQENAFGRSVLLDWITHGGCHLLTVAEVMTELHEVGFEKTQYRKAPGFEWEWIIAE